MTDYSNYFSEQAERNNIVQELSYPRLSDRVSVQTLFNFYRKQPDFNSQINLEHFAKLCKIFDSGGTHDLLDIDKLEAKLLQHYNLQFLYDKNGNLIKVV